MCDIEPLHLQARRRVYFVWSRYTNIYLDACDRKGGSRPDGAVSGQDLFVLCLCALMSLANAHFFFKCALLFLV